MIRLISRWGSKTKNHIRWVLYECCASRFKLVQRRRLCIPPALILSCLTLSHLLKPLPLDYSEKDREITDSNMPVPAVCCLTDGLWYNQDSADIKVVLNAISQRLLRQQTLFCTQTEYVDNDKRGWVMNGRKHTSGVLINTRQNRNNRRLCSEAASHVTLRLRAIYSQWKQQQQKNIIIQFKK